MPSDFDLYFASHSNYLLLSLATVMTKIKRASRILVIDDEASIGEMIATALTASDPLFEVEAVSDSREGLRKALEEDFHVVVTDFRMPGMDGLALLKTLNQKKPLLPVILTTSYGTIETTVEAGKLGVFDFISKPFDVKMLVNVVTAAANSHRMAVEPVAMGVADVSKISMVGKSRVMQNLYLQIGKISASPVTALIQGPTGSGKELVARAIFHHSKRSKNPFITINCAAIPETLLESELFGHEKGSFTGAERQRIGRFEQANTGTIFLDEIGEMTLGTQAKLLRVLQEKEIQRVGGKDLISIDVRVIAATHHDLAKAVKEKKFREDLFYRLAVITLEVPGLKERTEDIPDLIRYFIARHGPELGFPRSVISKEVVEALSQRHWPGNIRQLENAVSELILLARGHLITQHHLGQTGLENGYASQSAGEENGDSLKALVEDIIRQVQAEKIPSAWPALLGLVEKELYTQMSRTTRGNRSQMAKLLGVSRPTVQEKLEHYVIT